MGNAVSLACQGLVAMKFNLPKACRKGKLLLSSQGLIAKDDDVVVVKRCEDPILERGRQRARQINAADDDPPGGCQARPGGRPNLSAGYTDCSRHNDHFRIPDVVSP